MKQLPQDHLTGSRGTGFKPGWLNLSRDLDWWSGMRQKPGRWRKVFWKVKLAHKMLGEKLRKTFEH